MDRENGLAFDQGLARRGLPAHAKELIALDTARRDALTHAQKFRLNAMPSQKRLG